MDKGTGGSGEGWSVDSWRSKSIKQQPPYGEEDLGTLTETLSKIETMPPVVHSGEIQRLKENIAKAGRGEHFILHGGDCAERFQDCSSTMVENKLRILLQMSLVLTWQGHVPVVRILRGAGQFAKPRSSDYETVDGKKVPSYRGDNVNGFCPTERRPDPARLLQAYYHSATTCNYIRALLGGGFASLQYPHEWDFDFVKSEDVLRDYNAILGELEHGIGFLRAAKVLDNNSGFDTVDISISHEGLVLAYEQALTRSVGGQHYNLGAHFLWIGDRTRQLDGAHVEYFRGLANPVGLKCGPSLPPEELALLVERLNPQREEGKLTLITRYGCAKVEAHLAAHIRAVQKTGVPVTWVCDAVHGNTFVTKGGLKTRSVDDIWSEIRLALEVHAANNSVLGGVHLEMTGENVTECVGGSAQLQAEELTRDYVTHCDPRLNYTQSLDIAFRLAKTLKQKQHLAPSTLSTSSKKRKRDH